MWTYQYANITSATTTTVAKGPCELLGITVNKGVSAATITVYDNGSAASGNKIATIAADNPGNFFYGTRCKSGITVVTSGATDVTVAYS
jgi:hypothetical protein